LFLPGIPQVYYVGLMAGKNDIQTFLKTGVGRDVNRHNYTLAEWRDGLQQHVTQRVLALMQLRNTHPAFEGAFSVKNGQSKNALVLRWEQGDMWCEAMVDVGKKIVQVRYVDEKGGVREQRA
jgi:sucrose 6(F)-phosphate phosphorylase